MKENSKNKSINSLYFQDSPLNILISTALSESTKYDEGTWVQTKRKYFVFTWDSGKYKKTISQLEKCLTELQIQSGSSNFIHFSR